MSISELPSIFIYNCCDNDPMKTIKCKLTLCLHIIRLLVIMYLVKYKYLNS